MSEEGRNIQYVGRKRSYTDERIAASGLHWKQPGAVVKNVPPHIAKRLLAHPDIFYDCTNRAPKEVAGAFNIADVALRRTNYAVSPFQAVGAVGRSYDERRATMTVEFVNERDEILLVTMPLGIGEELAVMAEQLEAGIGGIEPFEEKTEAEAGLVNPPPPSEADLEPAEGQGVPADGTDHQPTHEDVGANAEHPSAVPQFSTDDLEAIRQGIELLDEDNPEHFSEKTGKPNVAALETILGRDITAEDRDIVWDDVLVAREELAKPTPAA